MKNILSVSLGASSRDHEVQADLLGEKFNIKRIGTDGDFKRAIRLLELFDGKVDAIGLGGVDIYLYAGEKRFPLRDGVRLMQVVKKTPVVDGSGLKNSLEQNVIHFIDKNLLPIKGKKVLMVSALDRFGMAKAFSDLGASMVFGDFIFSLGLDKPIFSLEELREQAEKLLPEIGKLPIGFLYPIGKKQEEENKDNSSFFKYYHESDIIAGDFHFIKKYLPASLEGKTIITNTVTQKDIDTFRSRKASLLVTTTPEFEGRSFGTNVLEAALLSLLQKPWEEVKSEDYQSLLSKLNFKPRIEMLNNSDLLIKN